VIDRHIANGGRHCADHQPFAGGDEPEDRGEESANMAQQEIMRAPRDVDKRRSSNIERAIQRVEDGTHGLFDSGGKLPSPRPSFERLHDSAKLHFDRLIMMEYRRDFAVDFEQFVHRHLGYTD
jgi:hypothetical protein